MCWGPVGTVGPCKALAYKSNVGRSQGDSGYTRDGEKDQEVQDARQVLQAGAAETWEETPQSTGNCGC